MLRKAVLVQVTNASPPFHSLIESRKADKDFEDFQDEITDNSVFLTTLTALASNQLQRCEELAGVDLGSSRLEALSAVMAGNTSCTHLILSPSRFEPGLGQEGTARTGSAERCHMFSLCRNIASASALTQLDITNCSLRSEDAKAVAAMLAQPECALRHLHLSRNPNFGQGVSSRALFQALHRNSHLQVLHVAGCHITCGRDLAEMLEVNTTLTELNIADNLMSLEVAVVALRALGGSKALTALDLSRSFLRHATAEAFSEALAHNGVLARLRVDGVELGREGESRLAAALRTNGALETIEGMEWLGVEMPPGEICRQGCGAIRQFWEDAGMRKPQETSTGPVRRMIPDWTLKVVMVGPGQAGKTSLVKTLRGEAFRALSERERTIGIEVSEIVLPGVDSGAQDDSLGTPRLRVFDFAGQQEYYTLHRFLLTSKALYLLVFDSTQVSPHPDMDDGAQFAYIERWLNIIGQRAPYASIIAVGTKGDAYLRYASTANRHTRIARERQASLCRAVQDTVHRWRTRLHAAIGDGREVPLPAHDSPVLTSAMVNLGTTELVKRIQETIQHSMPEVGQERPAVFHRLRDVVLASRDKMFLTWEDYKESAKVGSGPTDHESLVMYTRLLHEQGLLLYFRDVPALSHTVCVDPQAVVQQLAQVLRHDLTDPSTTVALGADRDPELQLSLDLFCRRGILDGRLAHLLISGAIQRDCATELGAGADKPKLDSSQATRLLLELEMACHAPGADVEEEGSPSVSLLIPARLRALDSGADVYTQSQLALWVAGGQQEGVADVYRAWARQGKRAVSDAVRARVELVGTQEVPDGLGERLVVRLLAARRKCERGAVPSTVPVILPEIVWRRSLVGLFRLSATDGAVGPFVGITWSRRSGRIFLDVLSGVCVYEARPGLSSAANTDSPLPNISATSPASAAHTHVLSEVLALVVCLAGEWHGLRLRISCNRIVPATVFGATVPELWEDGEERATFFAMDSPRAPRDVVSPVGEEATSNPKESSNPSRQQAMEKGLADMGLPQLFQRFSEHVHSRYRSMAEQQRTPPALSRILLGPATDTDGQEGNGGGTSHRARSTTEAVGASRLRGVPSPVEGHPQPPPSYHRRSTRCGKLSPCQHKRATSVSQPQRDLGPQRRMRCYLHSFGLH